jgi:hypothetical protein
MSNFYRVIVPSIAVGALMAVVNLDGTPWLSQVSLVLQP